MPTALQVITRKSVVGESEPLNILTFPTHERYETGLAKTGHRFYGWQGPNIKTWNTKYAPIPDNYHILNGKLLDAQLPLWVDIDLVLSQNKFGQYSVANNIARRLQCPLVTLEHTLPTPNMHRAQKQYIKSMKGDLDVFISEYSIEQWGWVPGDNVEVVHHGLDTDLFSPDNRQRDNVVCSVVNDWMNRDWCCGFKIWQNTTQWPNSQFNLNVWGDTPGLSIAAPDVPSLVHEYRRSSVFLNTSLISPVPTALLEAMSCGCAVVSTNTCMIPEFIKHGENGFLSNDPNKLREYTAMLLNDYNLARKIGDAARKTIVENFGISKFVNKWAEIFRKVL